MSEFYARLREKRNDDEQLSTCIERVVKQLEDTSTTSDRPGILLGRIQSGKTRAFVGVIARAFDRGFDVAIVLTKGTKTLSAQTVARLVKSKRYRESWHTASDTERLLSLMSVAHRRRILFLRKGGQVRIGTLYRRMRSVRNGPTKQRAEVRFDEIAGCVRTPVGGSSRQIIIFVGRDKIRTRLLAIEEGARLMGLPNGYSLPKNYYEAFHVLGDGLAVPLVRFLSSRLLLPLLRSREAQTSK